jgi:secondary thiamine-phosphate synthase enzyme
MASIFIKTKGETDIIDITDLVGKELEKKQVKKDGVASLFVVGSTASLTTTESDENLYQDLRDLLEKIAPYKAPYKHHQTWGDDNGGAHLRASLIGPSLVIPVKDGKLKLGIWQRIVLIDFDTRPRQREVLVNFFEEK